MRLPQPLVPSAISRTELTVAVVPLAAPCSSFSMVLPSSCIASSGLSPE